MSHERELHAVELLREHDPAHGLAECAAARVAARLHAEPRAPRRSRLVLVATLIATPMAFASLYQGTHPTPAVAVHAARPVVRAPPHPAVPAEVAPPRSSVADEARALEPAVRALAQRDGRSARCALEAYARAFPHGLLQPEAEELSARVKGLPGSRASCDEP